MEIIKSVPTLIVLLISASAFFSGFYQNELINNSESLRSEAVSLQEDLARIEAKAQSIFIQNLIAEGSQLSSLTDLQSIDRELSHLKSTLGTTQINSYIVRIIPHFDNVIYLQEEYIVVKLFRYFEIQNNQDPYTISDLEVDGYDYKISRTLWDSWITTQGSAIGTIKSMVTITQDIVTNSDELLSYQAQTAQGIRNINSNDNQTITGISTSDKLDFMLFGPARTLSQEIEDKIKSAEKISGQIQQVSQAVSIITVSVILSGLMINRITDKKNEETSLKILKSLDIITETPEQKKDYISMPVLFAAGILSLFGLLLPLIIL